MKTFNQMPASNSMGSGVRVSAFHVRLPGALRGCLAAFAAAMALTAAGCKKQDAAILVTVNGQYRIPQDVDTLRIDTYDSSNTRLIISQSYTLEPGQDFPFTVLLVDSGTDYSAVKIIATATLTGNNRPVGVGEADDVSLDDGKTVDASITLADQ